ncbi:MAG: HNH endonuclease [bacterium]
MEYDQCDQNVLLLNTTLEPLSVINARRALNLLFSKKAFPVETSSVKIRTVRNTINLPSVIQIVYYIRKPFTRPRFSKKAIFMRDGFTCQFCGNHTAKPTVDHLIPSSKGGTNSWTNVVTACPECNNKKGDKTLEEVKMRLIRHPYEPKFIIHSLAVSQAKAKKWEKYFLAGESRKNRDMGYKTLATD